jgi:hypothetical protein
MVQSTLAVRERHMDLEVVAVLQIVPLYATAGLVNKE